jgi:alpha-tubulin suppressor-like RCC1 family protein
MSARKLRFMRDVACAGLAALVSLSALILGVSEARAEAVPPRLGAGYSHSCVRKADATLWCWGANDSGQLGNNTTQASAVPVQVTALGNQVGQVSVGDLYTCAVKFDQTLWCWGNNVAGQLGDGLTDDSLVPVPITAAGNDVVEVSAGDFLTCVRKGNGTVWCWGAGFLGDGTIDQRSTPGQVTALGNNVAQISTGGSAACARKTDGSVWCWGSNQFGIIGDGSTTDRLTPVQVTGLGLTVAEVSVGDVFACARTIDGNVSCWGTNDHGQLGDGSTADHLTPAVVVGLGKAAVQISANGGHACAVRVDNQLACWGSNFDGEVGDGTVIDRPNPVKVSVLPNSVAEVSAGVNHDTCARMIDGRVACWGFNDAGQLGDGTTVERHVPVQVMAGTTVPAVPAGGGWISAVLAFLLAVIALRGLRRAGGGGANAAALVVILGAALALGACSRDALGPEGDSGSVGVALTAGPGITFTTASYTITGPASFSKTASVDVSKSGAVAFTGANIPAGSGYTVSVTTSGSGEACTGSAGFTVMPRTTTNVAVHLTCHEPPHLGSVTFNGAVNVCPRVSGLAAAPAQIAVGKSLALGSNFGDSDLGPMPLGFRWSASSASAGTFDDATASATRFFCLAAGTVTLSLTVSDGDPAPGCAAVATISVTCLDPLVAQCSFPLRADGTACSDNNACTQGDSCHAGVCTGGAPVTCAALDQCHSAGVCDPSRGVCSNPNKADGAACNDQNACTQTDSCQSGACVGGSPVTCAALDQCHTAGTCDATSGVCSNPVKANGTSCNDGNLCTAGDACQAGSCTATPISCAAGADACHPGICDPANGTCSNPNACTFYGVGSLSATASDGVVGSKLLEDGTPHNQLGAFGSAISYTGVGNKYLVTPDRGPNAGLDSYDERYYLVDLALPGGGVVTPTLKGGATLNKSAGVTFSGLSSLFDPSNSPAGSRRLDSEGVRVTPAGTFWVSDEYGPFLYEFSATGDRLRFITLPSKFLIANPAAGDAELPPVNTSGRVVNRGMEGLAISPDGHRLYGLLQNGIMQDGELDGANKRVSTHNRLIEFNADTGLAQREFLYVLDNKDYGCNELLAVNDHQFLVIERDGSAGTAAAFKKLMLIDITGATDISGMASLSPITGSVPGVTPVSKQPFLDLLSPTFGLAGASFPEKIEGLAFGPDQPDGRHVLVVTNDNDFIISNPNNFYVFFIGQAALPGFQSQQATFSNLCANVTCPAPADACHLQGACNPGTGSCSSPAVAAGTAVGAQTTGDCQKLQCDGAGNIVSAADNADLPNDNNQCTQDSCSAGNPVFTPAPINAACSQGGGSFCDGAGACVACNAPTQCPGSDTECKARTCAAHVCGLAFAPNGQPLTTQAGGDCHRLQCDGSGASTSVIDNADVPVDGNQCTADVCTAGVPSNPATSVGSSCGGGVCDGAGTCTGCLAAADCPGSDTACASRTCSAGVCGMAFAPAGTATGSQTAGDCMANRCDGAGNAVNVVDVSDVPNDSNQCTLDSCSGAGVPSNGVSPANAACNQNGGNVCDGAGTCVATVRVVRVGAVGGPALSNASTAVFIEERRLDGNLAGTVSLPTAVSAPNQPFTLSGSASSEGALTLSTDGHALAMAGYATAPGLAGVASTTAAAVPRVVARIDAAGVVSTSTSLGTDFSGNNVRGALASPTGFWVVGATGGMFFVADGSTNGGIAIATNLLNMRTVNAWGGQLYGSAQSGTFVNVFSVGSGLPTTAPQTATSLPGMPTAAGPSPYAFILLDRDPAVAGIDTMYVADDRAAASGGGIQKWTLATAGGSWSLVGTLNVAATPIGFRGLTGSLSGGVVTLIGTTTDTLNRLVVLTDSAIGAPAATATVIATATTNTVYRGVALSPQN